MAEPIWLTDVPDDEATVAFWTPVAALEDSASAPISMAALELPETALETSATSVIPVGGANVEVAPLVPLRTAAKVSSSASCCAGVMDGISTLGKATLVLISEVGVTSSGVVLSAPWMAADTAANRPEVWLMVRLFGSPACMTWRSTPLSELVELADRDRKSTRLNSSHRCI